MESENISDEETLGERTRHSSDDNEEPDLDFEPSDHSDEDSEQEDFIDGFHNDTFETSYDDDEEKTTLEETEPSKSSTKKRRLSSEDDDDIEVLNIISDKGNKNKEVKKEGKEEDRSLSKKKEGSSSFKFK